MKQIIFSKEYFNIIDTLECGQIFRFEQKDKGYLVFSLDKCAYLYEEGENVVIDCEDDDEEYFTRYFDLTRDYSLIVNGAINSGIGILKDSATTGKGIRILKQNPTEMLYSFMISQNNNIPRIKKSIFEMCAKWGEKKSFKNHAYYTFPTVEKLNGLTEEDFKTIGVGYRAKYLKNLTALLNSTLRIGALNGLDTDALRKELTSILGVGRKVADCVILFGFNRTDSFPVDTWLHKVYVEDFGGMLTDREQISKWFVKEFKENAGYFQQYLFDYKRRTKKQ